MMTTFSLRNLGSALLLTCTTCSAWAQSDDLVGFEFQPPATAQTPPPAPPRCEFADLQVPDDVLIYAAGAYSGRDLAVQIDQSGHAATQFDIAVNSPSRPVILILGAYEPSIWNIGWSEGTHILAVLATGYHRQVVSGVQQTVPQLISSYDNRGPCGYQYIGRNDNTGLNPLARKLFGKPVDLVYPGDESGRILVGEPLVAGTRMLTSAATPPSSYSDPQAPLAGKAGLTAAVTKGLIRPATEADAIRWAEEKAAAQPKRDVPPIAGKGLPSPTPPRLRNAYMVLQPFTYPAGLYGANSATFLIERGVPEPEGKPGHSAVYNFNTLTCSGATCGH